MLDLRRRAIEALTKTASVTAGRMRCSRLPEPPVGEVEIRPVPHTGKAKLGARTDAHLVWVAIEAGLVRR